MTISKTDTQETSVAKTMQLPQWKQKGARPFVRIENVTKKFDDFTAVDNVSLDIYENELFCLLGGSGSGKSTLLRMLAGFEEPTSGRILIDGVDMAGKEPWKRPVNMMFQSYALFPHLNVFENVAFGLKREGVERKEVKKRVEEMLALVQLSDYARRKPNQLSGGQRQRVALARALIKRPKLLLLDEPLGALDKKLREETQFELINLQDQLGVTFVVVTHDQEEAMILATRIGVMNEGVVVQTDEPRNVYEYPRNRFVAGFVGSVNMFEGEVLSKTETMLTVNSDELAGNIVINKSEECSVGQKVAVAIRPEKIQMNKNKPDNAVNCIKGIIEDYAYMGNMTVYRVTLPTGKSVRITQQNSQHKIDGRFTWQDTAYLSWGSDCGVLLFS